MHDLLEAPAGWEHGTHTAKALPSSFPSRQMDYRQLYTLASLYEWQVPQVNHISAEFLLLPEKHPQLQKQDLQPGGGGNNPLSNG